MIDNKRRRELLELIDGGDLERLKKYVEDENEKYYVHQAREQLTKFFQNTQTYYCVKPDGEVQISDGKSVLLVPRKDILPSKIEDFKYGTDHFNKSIAEFYAKFSEKCSYEVTSIKNDEKCPDHLKKIHYMAEEDKICMVNKAFLRRAQIVLGDENIDYKVCDEPNMCLLTSPRGKALILGLRE